MSNPNIDAEGSLCGPPNITAPRPPSSPPDRRPQDSFALYRRQTQARRRYVGEIDDGYLANPALNPLLDYADDLLTILIDLLKVLGGPP